MTEQLYVATDASGVQWSELARQQWSLPAEPDEPAEPDDDPDAPDEIVAEQQPASGVPAAADPDTAAGERAAGTTVAEPGDPVHGELTLWSIAGLLGHLDERVYRAEVLDPGPAADAAVDWDSGPEVHAASARLLGATRWDGFAAAGFALDCAAHVSGAASDVALPDGTPLGEVLERARRWLAQAGELENGHGGRLRQLALCWRLRRTGKDLGDVAFTQIAGDIGADLDALADPVWTSIAAARDAVLASVEAVQHAVLPSLTDLEARRYEHLMRDGDVRPGGSRTRANMPWVPYWVAADDAAERSRRAAGDAGGAEGEAAERAWQQARLAEVLG